MSDDQKKGFEKVRQEIDLRLDGLLGEFGKVLGEAMERLEDGAAEVRHSQNIRTDKGPVRAEAGIRIRMGGLDVITDTSGSDEPRPVNRGAARHAETASPETLKSRELSASIFEEPGLWSLTADLPGVTLEDLNLQVDDGSLAISAAGNGRMYRGEFEVPKSLRREDITVALNNGILDLTAPLPSDVGGADA